ncbi:MAG: ATP-binding cassette domain-containing protein [Candidatus Sumerlaeota bacterium]|nr:ATP-binding cassette domain-containing protein [Candidatus Sumerlaeota bacterium]
MSPEHGTRNSEPRTRNSESETRNSELGTRNSACAVLRAEDLVKYFPVTQGTFVWSRSFVRAVDGVNLYLRQGEVLGLVGESGCGKTTIGRMLARLLEPTRGRIVLQDAPAGAAREDRKESGGRPGRRERLSFHRRVQMVFQDPYSSLNPRMTAGAIVAEGLEIHGLARGKAKWDRVAQLFRETELDADSLRRYPHEFSGGQRQRIGIARALAIEPRIIIADEPVSALDVSIQAQILALLERLQQERGLSYVFISHDLSVVAHISHRVAVMYLGRIVETGTRDQVFFDPLHPYTQALLKAAPKPDPSRKGQRVILQGETPSPAAPPPGCHFHPRCPKRFEGCDVFDPRLTEYKEGHHVACRLYENE